jgi:hypothetical protein
MKIHFDSKLFYSPRCAAQAFEPSCGEVVIRRALKSGVLRKISVGSRNYIARADLVDAANKGLLK